MAHHIVCGLGQVGLRVVELLLRLGEQVTVITLTAREEFSLQAEAWGARVIIGDARSDKQIIEAGVLDADSILPVTENDLSNIEIALDANRLNPNIHIVIRLFDQSLARRLENSFGIRKALAMSSLSAPAFATAAFGETIRGSFGWNKQTYIIGELPGSEQLKKAADLNKACLIRSTSNADVLYQPTPEICSRGHQAVEVVCGQDDFLKFGTTSSETILTTRLRSEVPKIKKKTFLSTAKEIWWNAPPLLKTVALVIFSLAVISVFVFWLFKPEMKNPVDAIYFVVTTLTTTGYGDFNGMNDAIWMKLFICFVMLVGSAAIATMYSIVTDFVVSTRFDQMLGKKRVASDDHVIVVGLSNVGFRTVTELREMGADVVSIDLESTSQYRELLDRNTPYIAGDARDPHTLTEAGIDRATAIITTTDDDAMNLSIALTAKAMNPSVRTVCRLFEPDFARKVQKSLNVNSAMSATRIAAPTFVGSAMVPDSIFCCVVGERFIVVRPAKSNPNPHPLAKCSWVSFDDQDGGLRFDLLPLKEVATN